MQQHIIELSDKYQLMVSDNQFILYQLKLNQDGVYVREKAQRCADLKTIIETLQRLEIKKEDVAVLADILKVNRAIYAEIEELKAHIHN
ncbi:MAG: hypothetical protein SOX56_11520 [[Pasteurella] mairii]|nr:hypothetical protein [[Pasteurella] mairii]